MEKSETGAGRLIAAMHQTCSHDLPNQVVALHSLINLLEMDESENLDATGRDYLARLKHVAEKMGSLADFLKELARLPGAAVVRERIDLGQLVRELAAEARVSGIAIPWETRLRCDAIVSDRRCVHQSLSDLTRLLAGFQPAKGAVFAFNSIAVPAGIRVEIALRGPSAGATRQAIEKKLDYLLARERLAAVNVELHISAEGNESIMFGLVFPASGS